MGNPEKELYVSAENPEPEGHVDELTARFTEAVLGLVGERVGDLRSAVQDAGFSQNYSYRLVNRERKMGLDLAAKLMEMNGIPVVELARRLLDQEAGRPAPATPFEAPPPAQLLAKLREKGAEKNSPFLSRLAPFLEDIGRKPLLEIRKPMVWRATLMVLEEERTRDWRKTRKRLERYALALAGRLAGPDPVTRNDLVELASLIAAWAAVQRVAGWRNLALDALQIAFVLAERSADVWTQGFCLQKAAYLTHDLGHNPLALILIERAALCYGEAGTPDDLARILIDRGYFSYYCGRKHDALRLLEAGLRKVDPNQRLYIVAAHLSLARIHRERGDRSRARQELRTAIGCHLPDSVEVAYLSWEAAKQEREFQDAAAAEKLLRDSFRLFAQHGRGGDLAFVALDCAEILLEAQRTADLKRLFRDVLKRLEKMARAGRALAKPFENLAAQLALGGLGRAELDGARQSCEHIGSRLGA